VPELQLVEEKSFEAGENSRLFLSLPRADVRLRAGESERIRVALEAVGETPDAAQRLAEQTRLRVRFQADTVRVEAAPLPPGEARRWCALPSPVFRVEVALPPVCHVDAAAPGGRLEAENLEGHLVLGAQGGSLAGRGLSGRVEVQANACAGELEDVGGRHLHVDGASSRVALRDVHTENMRLALSGAEVEAARVEAALQLDLSDVTCTVMEARGPVGGHLRAGRLALHLTDAATPVHLRATHADLALGAPADLAAQLDLTGQTVSVDGRAASFEGKQDDRRVAGALNGGGDALITARAVEGEVRLTLEDGR
jgi:hypothetical protein